MKTICFTTLVIVSMALTTLVPRTHAAVPGMKVIRLHSPQIETGNEFGSSFALTDKYAVVGENKWLTGRAGRVHVFDAATGTLQRSLKPDDSAVNDAFGINIAVHGDLALVQSSPQPSTSSKPVYLFNLATGKQLRKFMADALDDGTSFGFSLTLSDRYACIGNTSGGSSAGSVYVFDLSGTSAPTVLVANDGVGGSFGSALYEHQGILLVGAPTAQNKGAIYRFDLGSGQMLGKIQPADLQTNDEFGSDLAGSGNSATASVWKRTTAAGARAGVAYPVALTGVVGNAFSFDSAPGPDRDFGDVIAQSGNLACSSAFNSTDQIEELIFGDVSRQKHLLTLPMSQIGAVFVGDIRLSGSRLLCGYGGEDSLGTDTGAVWLLQNLPEPLAGEPIATKGDSAPGAANIAYNDLNSATINHTGHVLFSSSLSGTGSNAGKDSGTFDDLGNPFLELAAKSRDDLGSGVKVLSVSAPLMNDANALFQATLTGTGVTSANNKSILRDNGMATTSLLRTGSTLSAFGGATLAGFGPLAQSSLNPEFASVLALRVGVGGTTATSDSGMAMINSSTGSIAQQLREGQTVAAGTLGQFLRVSYQHSDAAICTMMAAPATQNQALFLKSGIKPGVRVIGKGDPAPGITNGIFSAFLGETADAASRTVFRATVNGTGISSANNEGIWRNDVGTVELIARTGTQAPGQPVTVLWHRFLQVSPQADGVLIRGLLRGTGITAANDEIICLFQEDSTFLVLLREGAVMPGTNGAKLGGISRMEVSPTGHYRLLVTLTGLGVSATNNLALVGGSTALGNSTTDTAIRKPVLLLRKGSLISLSPLATPARVSSLAFTHAGSQDTTGMGCKGLPSVVSAAGTLIKATLSDGTTHLLRLK